MSRRSVRDWMSAAFFARDKASFVKVADEAEAEFQKEGNGDPEADTGHEEPDGDEGDKHHSNVHIHIEHGAKDGKTKDEDPETRLKGCEDKIAQLDAKISKVIDALPPEFLKHQKGGEGDDESEDEMPPELAAAMEGKEGNGETEDEGIPPSPGSSPSRNEGSPIPPGKEQGTLEAKEMPEGGDAELLDPSGALHTGKSNMGDKKYTGDAAKRVNAAMAKLLRETVARAEMITPGIKLPSFDAVPAEGVQKSYGQLCGFRRNVLLKATTTDKGRQAIGRYTADAIKKMSCDSVGHLFIDATDRARVANNARVYEAPSYEDKRTYHTAQQARLHAINEANREFWSKQTGSVRH